MRYSKVGDPITVGVYTSTAFKWTISAQTSFNADTGEQRIILTHELKGNILYTDEITF